MDWKPAQTAEDSVTIPKRWLLLHYYEALNILFRMENSLRVFTYLVLKAEFKDKWSDIDIQLTDDGEHGTIAATAARRITQANNFGYLGYGISSPLLFLNTLHAFSPTLSSPIGRGLPNLVS